MSSIQHESTRGNAGPSKVRADKAPRGPWVNRVPPSFLDARTPPPKDQKPLGHRLGWMLLILEGFARDRAYCWVGNAELAAAYGCVESTAWEILRELQRAGAIVRVETEAGRHGRVGIVLRRRANADLPVADDDETLKDVIGRMRERRASPSSYRKTGPSATGNPGASSYRESGSEERQSLSLNNDESNQDDGAAAAGNGGEMEPSERQRLAPDPDHETIPVPELPTELDPVESSSSSSPVGLVVALGSRLAAGAAPSARTIPTSPGRARMAPLAERKPAEIAAAPTERTPGQCAWLATLTADEQARLEALPAEAQAKLLEWHRDGVNPDPILAREASRILNPKPVAPPPPMPTSTAELLAALPGGDPGWDAHAADMLIRDFGSAKDRDLFRAFHEVTFAVWSGRFPAAAVVDAHRQGMKAKAKGQKGGAVFNTALQRDHGWKW